jgi:hypothetical protein
MRPRGRVHALELFYCNSYNLHERISNVRGRSIVMKEYLIQSCLNVAGHVDISQMNLVYFIFHFPDTLAFPEGSLGRIFSI